MGWPLVAAAGIAAGSGLLGGIVQGQQSKALAKDEYERQKEFAQMGIRWKVEDAKAAGLHPLAALGANTLNYSPVRVGGTDYGLSKMGQDISRALGKMPTQQEKEERLLDLEIKRKILANWDLRNQGLYKDLHEIVAEPVMMNSSNPYGLTSMGQDIGMYSPKAGGQIIQGQQGYYFSPKQINPSEFIGIETGTSPFSQRAIDDRKRVRTLPTQQMSEPMESSLTANIQDLALAFKDYFGDLTMYYNPDSKKAKEWHEYLRSIKPRERRPGQELRYNPKYRVWVWRKRDGLPRLFDVDRDGMFNWVRP